eukprot:gene26322-31798_t
MKTTSDFSKSVTRLDTQDRTVEGLRIPANLNATHAVNFVLTQEPGKLKPKDLKIAIEKNRAERDKRAEEQRKLREQGGGAGVLDVRGILAEERLNYEAGDPFRRQLRELSFLADVEEVDKQEAEKEFRVSEDYFGSTLLSNSDIEVIKQQRVLARQQALKSQWRQSLGRQEIKPYLPHMGIKAGTLQSTAQTLLSTLNPSFDPNRNDIFAKRLNTLRKFIYLVSKWIIRRRVSNRMQKILDTFHKHNAYTREEFTLRQAGFAACNTYLFGGLESDVKLTNPHQTNPNLPNPPPPPGKINYAAIPEIGPVFSDYYTADTDRHVSGLNCFARDTDRTLLQWDLDIAPLQAQQAKEDVLTDSDSDNEEAYASEKPSMALVKRLLSAPVVRQEEPKDPKKKPDKKDDKKDAKAPPVAAPVAPSSPGFNEDELLNENDRRSEQVELLRDRKLLDFASTIQKQRKKLLEEVYQTYSNVASKSVSIYSLPVTVPFHMYEEEVYQHMSKYVPERSQVLVELDPHLMAMSQLPTAQSTSSLPPFSPTKYK